MTKAAVLTKAQSLVLLKLDASLDLFSGQCSWVLDNAFNLNSFCHGFGIDKDLSYGI